jgi:hypothetical protein
MPDPCATNNVGQPVTEGGKLLVAHRYLMSYGYYNYLLSDPYSTTGNLGCLFLSNGVT